MLREEKIVEVLEAFDLTESYRAAGLLCGVDHHTVRRYVLARGDGLDPTRVVVERVRGADPFAEKILEWIERSNGRIRADVVHRRLVAMGYRAGERTTRRVVAAMKATWAGDHRRVYKPWIPSRGCGCSGITATGRRSRGCVGVVLRLVGLVSVPGGPTVAGPDDGVGHRGVGCRVSGGGRGADVRVDRQREDCDRPPHRRDRGAEHRDRVGGPVLRAEHRHLCPL